MTASGAALCLACGLCCQGTIYVHADLLPEEAARLRRRSLPVVPSPAGGERLALPASCHARGRCTIYEERPRICAEYRCDQLRGLEDGSIALDDALERVARAKALAARLSGRLRRLEPGPGAIWDMLMRYQARVDAGVDCARDPVLYLDVVELAAHLQKHFDFTFHGRDAVRPA
jgi:hypothetical protein